MKFSAAIAQILAAALLMALAGPAAAQQAYPNKPVRFIVPYPPGGGTNAVARLVGQKLTESWGQQVIVDNRPGANGIIGGEALVKAPPDGYTILLGGNAHITSPLLVSNLPYDTARDFAPVAALSSTEMVLVLNPSLPANDLKEFIALAKSRPGQLNFSSSGSGTLGHLSGELFNIMTGVKMQHIPYKGSAQALTDLLGGQVQLSLNAPFAALVYIKTGKLKGIAISGQKRYPSLPQVPTFSEAGLPGYDVTYWTGVLAPARTPKEIIDTISAAIARILAMPDVRQSMVRQGMDAYIANPEQYAALMKAMTERYARIIKAANIKLE